MQEQKNPFDYGRPVTKGEFAGREDACRDLKKTLLSGQSVILYSPRKTGKTSLIKQTELTISKKEAIVVYIDLFGISSKKELVKKITSALFSTAYPRLDKVEKAVGKILKKLAVKISIMKGAVSIEFSAAKDIENEELEETFELPQKIAEDTHNHIIVVFDEFQDVLNLDGAQIEKLMRAKFQFHRNVTYLFAGSKMSIMRALFMDRSHAFYKFGRTIPLPDIPAEEFAVFIKRKFREAGKSIDNANVERVLKFTNGHPYHTQKLCWFLWHHTMKTVDEEGIETAIDNAVSSDAEYYENIWSGLSNGQKNLLMGLTAVPNANRYSISFISEFGLNSPGYVKRAMSSLEKKRILEDGKITDVFFADWIERRSK